MKPALATRIFELPDDELGLLFKPVQLRVIDKISKGAILSSNEKRYLRGRLGTKLRLLDHLVRPARPQTGSLGAIVSLLGEYYITGYAALKHNGYGWYFEPRRIEVVNTRLDGRLTVDGKVVVFRRVKSIGPDWWATDSGTDLKYATNERILVDAQRSGQDNLVKTWISMLERYGKIFVKYPRRYQKLLSEIEYHGEPEDYGV
jgi:hypothetical protein